jgi:hypothetical protein
LDAWSVLQPAAVVVAEEEEGAAVAVAVGAAVQ